MSPNNEDLPTIAEMKGILKEEEPAREIVPFGVAKVDYTEAAPTNGWALELPGERSILTYRFVGESGIGIEISRPTLDGKTSKLAFGLSEDAATALIALLSKQFEKEVGG
jgi:hypothetical protein